MPTRLAARVARFSGDRSGLTRREILSLLAKGALAAPLLGSDFFAIAPHQQPAQSSLPSDWQLTDAALLEEIVSHAVSYFWNEASPRTGLVRDRALADGKP